MFVISLQPGCCVCMGILFCVYVVIALLKECITHRQSKMPLSGPVPENSSSMFFSKQNFEDWTVEAEICLVGVNSGVKCWLAYYNLSSKFPEVCLSCFPLSNVC